jgi:hypothetical protein
MLISRVPSFRHVTSADNKKNEKILHGEGAAVLLAVA